MSDDQLLTRDELLQQTEAVWNDLQTYLDSRTAEQLTQPTDAAGWTAKDHVIHIAAWERATIALLAGKSKREAMDISVEVWELDDDDATNAVLQTRYKDMPLDEVLQTSKATHHHLMTLLNGLTEADLRLPYRHYQPSSNDEHPLVQWLPWDTFYHYRDHLTWIKAIVDA